MLESPKLGKWVRIDKNEYELTKLSTNWLKSWVRIDQNENELTWVRTDLSTSWLGANQLWSLKCNIYTCHSDFP